MNTIMYQFNYCMYIVHIMPIGKILVSLSQKMLTCPMKNYSSMTRITPMIFFMFPIKQKVMCYWNLGSQNLICGLWLSVWNQEVVFFRCFPWCSIKPERYLNLLRSWKAQTRVHYCLYFKIQCHFQNMDDFITTFLPFLCYQFVKLNSNFSLSDQPAIQNWIDLYALHIGGICLFLLQQIYCSSYSEPRQKSG